MGQESSSYGEGFSNDGGMKDFLRNVINIPNPHMPLSFEVFSEDKTANVSDDPELEAELEKRISAEIMNGALTVAELGSFNNNLTFIPDDEVDSLVKEAHIKSLEAYMDENPVEKARDALKIAQVPEAYNVLALKGAKTLEEALAFYNLAALCAPKLTSDFKQMCKEGKCWENHFTRSYVRATHGQANTLRKLGRYAEAEKKYRHLLKINPTMHCHISSYVNWRYHFIEVFLKQGKDEDAWKWAHSRQMRQCYGILSSQGAFFWSLALAEYRFSEKRGYDEDYYTAGDDNSSDGELIHKSLDGPLLKALQCSPHVLEFLIGKRKLPCYPIPMFMGETISLSNAAMYCVSSMSLWKETPGAIDWATKNANTFICASLLNDELGILKSFNIPNTDKKFRQLIKEGIYIDATVSCKEDKLVHLASKTSPARLQMLLQAGANPRPAEGYTFSPLVSVVLNDGPLLSIKYLIKAGCDPLQPDEDCTVDTIPIYMAASFGHARSLHTILVHTKLDGPKHTKICVMLLETIFDSEYYECATGTGSKCHNCMCPCCKFSHLARTDFPGCITAILASGFKVTKKMLIKIKKTAPKTKLDLVMHLEREMTLCKTILMKKMIRDLQDSPQDSPTRVCAVCKATQDKLLKCSRCRRQYYCSRECQKSDWPRHKISCSK